MRGLYSLNRSRLCVREALEKEGSAAVGAQFHQLSSGIRNGSSTPPQPPPAG